MDERLEAAQRLMEVMGSQAASEQTLKMMLDPLLAEPELTEEEARIIREVFAEGPSVMCANSAKLYARDFTVEELQFMVDFYRTPTGRKVIDLLPKLMQESFEFGQKWAKEIMPKVIARVESQQERWN